jgi:tetratricopeptide (TPR) repeat protein
MLADHAPLRLVLLNSCAGAQGSQRDVFSSTASILVRRGISAVVSMQYEITDGAAIEFSRAFYRALAYGLPVDEAVVAGRKAISLAVTNTVEWGTPVLYMCSPDVVLFQMPKRPRLVPAPPEVAKPPVELDEELEQRLEQLYVDGLGAFWVEDWDEAHRYFQAIVDERPGYRDAGAKLGEVERQQEWGRLYKSALAARDAGDWVRVVSSLEGLVAEAPDYKDAAALLEMARRQVQLAELYGQAGQLHRAEQWQAVVNVFAQIAALDPDFPDPEAVLSSAEQEIAAQKHRAELDDLYRRAVLAVDAGRWAEARGLLVQIEERAPGYRETERLLAKAEAETEREDAERWRKQQIAALYNEAHAFARAGQWQQALAKMNTIRSMDPQFADPAGIGVKARAEAAREEAEARHQEELAGLYAEAVHLSRAKQYQKALEKWDQVRARDPQYPDRHRVQSTARKRLAALAKPSAPAQKVPALKSPLVRALAGIAALLVLVLGGLAGARIIPGLLSPTPTSPTPPVALTTMTTPTTEASPTAQMILSPTQTLSLTTEASPMAQVILTPTLTVTPTAANTPELLPSPELGEPADGAELQGEVTFRWSYPGGLPLGSGFQLVIWQSGDTERYGAAEAVRTPEQTINLDNVPQIQQGGVGDYLWSVRVIRERDGSQLSYLANPRRFRYLGP